MPRFLSVLLILVFTLSASALGFDGQRKGFAIGGGIGIAYAALEDWGSKPGFGGKFTIGKGVGERDVLAVEFNGVYLSGPETTVGYLGPVWYLYNEPVGNCLFTVIGVGASFLKTSRSPAFRSDIGFMLGFGAYLGVGCHAGVYGSTATGFAGEDGRSHHHFCAFISGMVL
ncbi:MAG: hypothetical protein GY867_07120 [bacterium]|nr:hypothetical protein [bacterium]